ncbi:MAG: Clp protease N-terminal domain-containing protein [Solirubrobacteraceae bacterium]
MLGCLFERFTQTARKAVSDAQEQARALGHNFIGVEHLLLGVLHEPASGAAEILSARGVSEEAFRVRLLEIMVGGENYEAPPGSGLPFAPRAKKVLEFALREALALGRNAVGTEHLLLGIAGEQDSVAMRILREGWDLYPEAIRGAVIEALPTGLIPADRGVPVPGFERVESSIGGVQVVPSPPLRRLLMAAAALALDDRRTEIDIDDVWRALTREPTAMRLASELGIDEHKVREAIKRRDGAIDPPEASAGA